jgi:hypothetical protein
MMNLDILNAVVRDLLISEGKYHQYKNKVFKSKKSYKRKDKHKKKNPDD